MRPDSTGNTGPGKAAYALLAFALSGCATFGAKSSSEEWTVVDGCLVKFTGVNVETFSRKGRAVTISEKCKVTVENETDGGD